MTTSKKGFFDFCRLGFCLAFVSCLLINEQAAVAQSQEAGVSSFARQAVRIDQLETEIRRLTGQNERINFKIEQIEGQLQSLRDRLDSAAMQIERLQQFGSSAQSVPDGRSGNSSEAFNKPGSPGSTILVPGADKGARVLGVITADKDASANPLNSSKALSPTQLYEKAQGFLAKGKDFDKAAELLQILVVRYPNHSLAPNAHYWLGRAYFVRGDFRKASFSFAEGLQKFPKSQKASANLLNLGVAFLKLGKKREACTTWGQLSVTYPNAPEAIKRRVGQERRKAKCF
ncbi:MAG: tol-pal system protein YbgF [Pseudomonadota bacterium]|nr:tol-pal system protein YbgF [Pseudomonadota bacterium]